MADAAASQAESLAQITTAVSELDRSTQHNAAMAEECTAAAGSLTREAGLLDQALARFSVSRAPNPPSLGRAA
jgi:methyl-accepting chemotaxis protein